MIGFYLGIKALQVLAAREYHWVVFSQIPSTTGKLKRFLWQFTPESWKTFQWHILDSPRHYFGSVSIIALMTLIELNAFFLKYNLWIHPPNSDLNVLRLFLWWFICLPGSRELYEFTSNEKEEKIGFNCWLGTFVALVELLVIVKFRDGMYAHVEHDAHPKDVVFLWIVIMIALVLFPLIWFFILKKHVKTQDNEKTPSSPKKLSTSLPAKTKKTQ
eukprot:TRINITY_DN423_c0_g1_i1.p1 TRINITY_DN423_c0_g1~~TRINITY_DN423_c0_g1_i1.p1  ORF type:complete len:216 (-),score=47.09 TRINITY_DN423_c0_g1_i1:116-763(-)